MNDRLSPILVKELRQGLRARVFEGSFLTLQALMVFAMVIAVSAAAAGKHDVSKGFGDIFFWAMVGIPLLLIMPMRGASAIRPEVDNKALELIFLTRLSAWRIVTGKWAALFCQTCLLVCAILPYAVLRYYLGNVDVARDCMIILGLLAASALLTALTVSVSAFPSKLARGLVLIFPILVLNIGPIAALPYYFFYGSSTVYVSSSAPGIWSGLLLMLAYVVLVTAYILEVGAARIAPPAENHAIAKRLLGLAMLALGPIGILCGADKEILLGNLALLTPVCVDALCSPVREVPGVFLPFVRRKGGGLIAPFLLPGWPSGILYTGVVILLCGGMLWGWGLLDDPDVLLGVVALAGALLVPVAIILVFRPQVQRFGTAYIAMQLAFLIFTGVFLMLNEAFNWHLEEVLYVSPISTLVLTLVDDTDVSWFPPTAIAFALSLVIVAAKARSAVRRLGTSFNAALDLHHHSVHSA